MPTQSRKPPTEYEKIRALWYKKLEEEGFVDIEQDDGNLKVWAAQFATKYMRDLRIVKEPYYIMATNFLNDYKFSTRKEKIIWEYHTEGLSIVNIVATLKKLKIRKLSVDTKVDHNSVWRIISRLEKAMKSMYLSSQNDDK